MVQGQFIHTFHRWKNDRNRLTFAGLAAFGHIWGPNINFIEMWDPSSQAEAGGILVPGEGLRDVQLNNFRGAPGIGGRIAWNQSTILRLDYAQSREGGQFFFGFGHIF